MKQIANPKLKNFCWVHLRWARHRRHTGCSVSVYWCMPYCVQSFLCGL